MRARVSFIAAIVVTALTRTFGCRSATPEAVFAEAEQLRLRYEKHASREAIARYQDAITAWKGNGDRRGAARAAQGVGDTYGQLGLLQRSVEAYRLALSLAVESPDRVLESEIRSAVGLGEALVAESEEAFEQARAQCERGLELAKMAGSQRAEAKALNCLGEVAYYRFRLEDALVFYLAAGRLWESLGDAREQAQTALYQGYVHSDLSRFDQARACYERARSAWISLGDRREQAITLVADARLQLRVGEYQDALNKFQAALTLLQPMGDAVWEGSALTGIGEVYLESAETSSALQYWERALEIFETAGLKQIAVDVLMYVGATYLASGDDTRALSRFERALLVANELGIERWRAIALRFIGVVYLFRELPGEARQYLESSLAAQRFVDHPRLEGATHADLGEARTLQGQRQLAVRDFDAALAVSRAAGDRVTQARALFGLARTSAAVGDLDDARRLVEDTLSIAESLRTATENRDLRASYLASVYRYHDFHMDILMRLHKVRPRRGLALAAFEASERARARSLLDGLAEAGVDLRAGVDPDLLKREDILNKAFSDWAERQTRLASSPTPKAGAETRTLSAEYRELEERYGQVQAEIRSKSPRYVALVKPQPLSLAQTQKQVLGADTLLLEYALGDERSYLWALSDKAYFSYELPPRAQIERAARRAYDVLTARLAVARDAQAQRLDVEAADAAYWTEATRLSEMLLGAVAGKLAGKRLLVVADGALQYVPFSALPVPTSGKKPVPMIVEHEIVSLPSASVLGLLRQEHHDRAPPSGAIAVVADPVFELDDPRLVGVKAANARFEAGAAQAGGSIPPEPLASRGRQAEAQVRDGSRGFPRLLATRQEAAAILATATGKTLKAFGFDASRATVIGPELAQYKIVHFATHGVFDNENPGLSGIALSMFDERGRPRDGFLRLHDIYGLHLPAELVVLSACDTALGRQVTGEGLVGVVRGFMYAGAKRVVASLWKVDDEATGELMRVFYKEMLERHRAPADALRQAQLALRDGRRWHEPFYWAAFVLQGEPN